MSDKELDKLLVKGEITLTRVIDRVVELNGIIGVGLITFGDDIAEYIKNKGGRGKRRQI